MNTRSQRLRGRAACALALALVASGAGSASAQVCVNPSGPIEFEALGDLNGSGVVNVADAVCATLVNLAVLAGDPMPGCLAVSVHEADLNCDGTVTVSDVQLLTRLAMSMPLATDPALAGPACADTCMVCPDSLTHACIFVDQCLLAGTPHPSIACSQCVSAVPLAGFSSGEDGEECGDNLFCVSGSCTVSPPPVPSGSFGAAAHVSPGSTQTSSAVTLTGFYGTAELTTSGDSATVQVLQNGSWVQTNVVEPGQSVRVVMTAAAGNNSARSVTVSAGGASLGSFQVTTWFYTTGSTTSWTTCSGSCSSTGSQSTSTWNCNRSDGTSGHAQSNCSSPNQTQSCSTPSCLNNPPSISGNNTTSPTATYGNTSFEVQCSPDGGGFNAIALVSAGNNTQVDIQLNTSTTGRVGNARITFGDMWDGVGVTHFQAGTGANSFKQHMCFYPWVGQCQLVSVPGNPSVENCSSPISCRVRRTTDNKMWYYARGIERSAAYMTSSSFRSAREPDHACWNSTQWAQGRLNSGLNGPPCYGWQPTCPWN